MLKTYSYSALHTYRDCPRKYSFQYLEKPEVPRRLNADTYLGTSVHRVLRRLYQLGADDVVIPVEQMLALYQQQWDAVTPEYLVVPDEFRGVDDIVRSGEQMLRTHYETYQPFNQGTLLGTEMYLTFQVADLPVTFRAYVDRLWRREEGVVEICDYKTGRHLARPTEPTFLYQMGLYQLAVQQTYPQFAEIDLAQYFLRLNEVVRHRLASEQLAQLADELRAAVLETHRAQRLDDFPPQEGGHCHYCDYYSVCPAKRHRVILERKGSGQAADEQAIRAGAAELASRYLDVYQRARDVKAELDGLRAELIEFAKEHGLTRMEGDSGHVSVRLSRKEKFPTRTDDATAFADLSQLAREYGLDEYFTLDANSLMKEILQKKRLAPEQLEQLKQFVVEREEARVTARLNRETDTEADNEDK